MRIHFHSHHVIVYTADDDRVFVLRVLGERQDWQAILSGDDYR